MKDLLLGFFSAHQYFSLFIHSSGDLNYSSSLILDGIFFTVPGLSIVEGVCLKVKPGSVTAVIGRKGAGKSTLLKIAAGHLQAESGITVIDGERIHSKSLKKRFQKISYLPQKSTPPGDMPVNRLIKSFSSAVDLVTGPFMNKRRQQKISELSSGEKRLLEISLLFSLNRKYILLDEPFTGVEPYIAKQIIERINNEAQKGRGILLTTHQHRYVPQVADKAYLLMNKQCYELEGDLPTELNKLGYITI